MSAKIDKNQTNAEATNALFCEMLNGGNNMKSTGIVRKIDGLGRIVLPIELRRTLEIGDSDSLEIFIEDNTIILKKYQPACVFCGNAKDISTFKGRNICPACAAEIARKL